MGEFDKKINSYIAGFVQKFLPRHEEIIHSGLFVLSSKQKDLNIFDWYYNGYSVISETISSYLRLMCYNRIVEFTNDGLYSLVKNQTSVQNEDLAQAIKNIEDTLVKYGSGFDIIREAKKIFSSS